MSNNKTGGPAFPQPCTENGYAANSPFEMAGGGMTLRDYFAAKALPAAIAKVQSGIGLGVSYPENTLGVARSAYALADAMLKARDEVKS